MKKIVLTAFFIAAAYFASAQVKGTVIDSASKKPIDKAVIGLVVKNNPKDTIYTFTNEKGEFRFETVPASNFSVIISNMGYQPVAKFVPVSKAEKTIALGNIILADRAKMLGEVIVQAAPIVIKEDTVEYNAASFAVKENASTEDLLKKLPGVSVDKDGNVTAHGKQVNKIKVNGKEFFGGDVKTATRELPANIIDKVQVIDDYGDQANISGIKDGEPTKTINLQLKKDKNKGYFGRVTLGGGTQDRYLGSFNGNYFNNNTQISLFANSNNTNQSLFNFGGGGNRGLGSMMRMGQGMMNDMGGMSGISNAFSNGDQGFFGSGQGGNSGITASNSVGFNYRADWSKKISAYGSYSYSHRNTSIIESTSTQNFFANSSFTNVQDANTLTTGDNHRLYFNIEYNIDSFNYLKVSPGISYAGSESNSNKLFSFSDGGGAKTSDGNNKNASSSDAPNFSGDLLFNHKFRKRGRNFSAGLSFGQSYTASEQDAQNNTSQYGGVPGSFKTWQYIDQRNDNHNYGFNFTYSEPLSRVRTLDIRYSHSNTYARNNRQTFRVDPASGLRSFSDSLSNDYENNFYNNRIGVSVRTTFKKYNYTVGLSLQPVNLQGNSVTKDSAYRPVRRVNLFPIFRFAYNFSRSKTLNISYRGNAQQPSFSQLQDVADVSNPQFITTGNPNLKPSITHTMNFSYNNFNFISGKILFTNLSVSTTQNQVVNNTIRQGNTGAQLTRPENVNGYYNINGFYTFGKPYKNRKYVLTLMGTVNYNHNINLVDNVRNIGQNWIVSQNFNFEFNYKEWLQLGTGIGYSLNDVQYKNPDGTAVKGLQNTSSSAWTFSNNASIDIPKGWVLRYDFDYTLNSGIASSISRNLAIMNGSIEKQVFKKKNGIIKLAAFDLFNQNTNVNRSVNANAIVDTRSNRLTRYFMLSLTYRLQKFSGKQPANSRPGGMMRMMGGG
jgi:Outer membrane protein beta-barrel family/CarboxypepD_reg-like domain